MSYFFLKRNLKKCCYWCSEEDKGTLSDDHLPPKSIFPKEDRVGLQLITVKICETCKMLYGRKGEDDNTFIRHMRLWASMSLGSGEFLKRFEECIKYSAKAQDLRIVEAEYLQVELSNGKIMEYPILKGSKEGILRVLDSIARGFYYRMKGEFIPKDILPHYRLIPKDSYDPPINILTVMPRNVVKKGVFEFATNMYRSDSFRYLCWEFSFYNLWPLPIYYSYYMNSQST